MFRTTLFALFLPLALFGQLQSPSEFLPHEHGAQFTPHHLVVAYAKHVADQSDRVSVQQYGTTPEGRPLLLLTVSSPENLAQQEAIRQNNLRRAGLLSGQPEAGLDRAIVWLSFGVHGNEAAATESAMSTLYELARTDSPQALEWLAETLVLIDPSLNPDGYDRYTHWYRGVAPLGNTPERATLEHREPWPGGRVNHYLFDLNRDWAWQTQTETQQRADVYHLWMPHLHVDFHEQFPDSPYYFAPAARPYHAYITDWQAEFQHTIGQGNARYFDKEGWLYFTREVFDLFYPSYGDTYPTFKGAIGMTYEQAGHGMAGRGVLLENGDTLTLHDRIAHHTTAALATVETASRHREELVRNFEQYFRRSASNPPGRYKTYVVSKGNAPGKLTALTDLLDRNRIAYGTATAGQRLTGFDYTAGEQKTIAIEEGDLLIDPHQLMGVLVQVLFEPVPALEDSLTYDITAWALPYAYGLSAGAFTQRLPFKPGFELPKAEQGWEVGRAYYAYASAWSSFSDARFLAALMKAGVKVRAARGDFRIDGKAYEPGAIVITRADNRKLGDRFDALVQVLAQAHGQPLDGLRTGFADDGFDLGSSSMQYLAPPKVALLSGEKTNSGSFGEVWHYLEQGLGYPVYLFEADRFGQLDLSAYNTLIMPEGRYGFSESELEQLKTWVSGGGRLIAIGSALSALEGQNGFGLEHQEDKQEMLSEPEERLRAYGAQARQSMSAAMPGAIFKVELDRSHPLAYGLGEAYFSLKTSETAYQLLQKGWNAGYLGTAPEPIGFAGSEAKKQLPHTLVFGELPQGRGSIVYLVDNPLFRGFWEDGRLLFSNALFQVGR